MRKKNSSGRGGRLFMVIASLLVFSIVLTSSSHREAPMIANDPLADNTDVYAFKSPTNPDKIILIANYVPFQSPQGGPNYFQFGEDVRYEIHIDNNIATYGDDIVYRFTFHKTNEDPTTFFNIRLGKQNLKTTYTAERSINGGRTFKSIITNGIVPPPNIGERSISSPVGLNTPDYNTLINQAIKTSNTGEKVFCGPVDDPFFVDLGGIFDLGDAPRQGPTHSADGLKCINVSTIALEIDISTLQKDHKSLSQAANVLDPNYVIGVWASASRQKITVLKDFKHDRDNDMDHGHHRGRDNNDNDGVSHSGPWVQVSRLGMPLTNEVINPIGDKDLWNSLTPYEDLANLKTFGKYFYNPELALYMDDAQFGGAIPAFSALRMQKNSLGQFGFGNGQNGLFALKGSAAVAGTALDDAIFGNLLLPNANSPRSVDLYPIFQTGVPNLSPYQLATGKAGGNPLAAGKPFINNFLPNGGDMLRLNMAVPATPRNSPDFSSDGLLQAAVLGLLDPRFNTTSNIQFIPNMDGFPNGRRLEDDATRIELKAVGGIVLAVLGLWYDDYIPGTSPSPVTPNLLAVLGYNTGVNANDTAFKTVFPFVQTPWSGTHNCGCENGNTAGKEANSLVPQSAKLSSFNTELRLATPEVFLSAYPNPSSGNNVIKYHVEVPSHVRIVVFDVQGRPIRELVNKKLEAGTYTVDWNTKNLSSGAYFITAIKDGNQKQTIKLVKD